MEKTVTIVKDYEGKKNIQAADGPTQGKNEDILFNRKFNLYGNDFYVKVYPDKIYVKHDELENVFDIERDDNCEFVYKIMSKQGVIKSIDGGEGLVDFMETCLNDKFRLGDISNICACVVAGNKKALIYENDMSGVNHVAAISELRINLIRMETDKAIDTVLKKMMPNIESFVKSFVYDAQDKYRKQYIDETRKALYDTAKFFGKQKSFKAEKKAYAKNQCAGR